MGGEIKSSRSSSTTWGLHDTLSTNKQNQKNIFKGERMQKEQKKIDASKEVCNKRFAEM